jgi:hypothetical protein
LTYFAYPSFSEITIKQFPVSLDYFSLTLTNITAVGNDDGMNGMTAAVGFNVFNTIKKSFDFSITRLLSLYDERYDWMTPK